MCMVEVSIPVKTFYTANCTLWVKMQYPWYTNDKPPSRPTKSNVQYTHWVHIYHYGVI